MSATGNFGGKAELDSYPAAAAAQVVCRLPLCERKLIYNLMRNLILHLYDEYSLWVLIQFAV